MNALDLALACLAKAEQEVRLIPTVMMTHSPKDNALAEIAEARRQLELFRRDYHDGRDKSVPRPAR
jgi:hypothetical protein